MNDTRDRERVLVEFLLLLTSDLQSGAVRPLAEYLNLFPGNDEELAREFLALTAPGTAEELPVTRLAGADSAESGEDGRRLGPYRLLRELGRGGQGVVYLAVDTRLERRVALKVLEPGVLGSEDLVLRFQREAELTSRLDHPGICTVHDVGVEGGTHYIAMRYLEGGSLADRVRDRVTPRTSDEVDELLALVEKTARALHRAHETGIVHRDVKPSNVMLDADGEPVVVDFGFARDDAAHAPRLTVTGSLFGTPPYMSPEQLSGYLRPLDRRTDVYSLGVTLFECLTHRLPFEAPTVQALGILVRTAPPTNPRTLNPSISRDLRVVLETALEKDLTRRYATAADLADDLANLRAGRPIAARPAGPVLRARRWVGRNPGPAAALALVLIALGITSWFLSREFAFRRDIERLGDQRLVAQLLEREVQDLLPLRATSAQLGGAWLAEAQEVLARREQHERFRAALLAKGEGATQEEQWVLGLLDDLLAQLESLEGRLPVVEELVGRANGFRATWAEGAAAERWIRCAERVAASPLYGGLVLEPQEGLLPLDESPHSGLWEFLVVDTGALPQWNDDLWARLEAGIFAELWDVDAGELEIRPETGVVLVLLPGGSFPMGAQDALVAANPQGFEPAAPRHDVELAPFFLSKHELTQAQWMRLDEGRNPSWFPPGTPRARVESGDEQVTLTHPVESVSWVEAREALRRAGLELPTEAQWEYACRAGAVTAFSRGQHPSSLAGFSNGAGEERRDDPGKELRDPWDDGWYRHSPVGWFGPNPFGLYDLHGNVAEWCLDAGPKGYEDVSRDPETGRDLREGEPDTRVIRGGSYYHSRVQAACAYRVWAPLGQRLPDLGLRAARPLAVSRESLRFSSGTGRP